MAGPDLAAIAAARADLASADAERRALSVEAADLLAKRDGLLLRGVGGQELAQVEGRLGDLADQGVAADEARGRLVDRIGGLSDGLVTALGNPENAVATLDGTTPVALLPVRIETRYGAGNTSLRVRIFPDQIHLDSHDPDLTAEEVDAGRNYWTHRWPNLDDTTLADEAWTAMCAGFRPGRARYVVDRMHPTNQPAAGAPAFPDVTRREAGWSRPPSATVLPDRIVVVGYRRIAEGRYTELFRVWGGGVPDRLQVGPRPDLGEPDAPGGLPKDPGLDWVTDPTAAAGNGMLVTVRDVDLAGGAKLANGIDRLIVLGVDWTLDAAAAAAAVEALLTAQGAEGQLAFVPQGVATNNTSASRSGWSTDRAGLAAALDPAADPPAFDAWSAGRRLAAALGIGGSVFDPAPGADLREQRTQAALTDALWRATAGYYLVDLLDPLAKDPAVDADLRDHVANHLFAGGPLPTLQVGPQPYGVLPVVARHRYEANRTSRAETSILRVASVLRDLVEPLVATVPRLGSASGRQDVDETLLALLLRTPVPWQLRFREAVGPVQRKAMSVYWDKIAAYQQSWTATVWSQLQTYTLVRLSELTLDPKDHPLDVALVLKGAGDARSTSYLGEIKALLTDANGELALRLRENSEALLEALIACAAANELDRVAAAHHVDVLEKFHPELVASVPYAASLHVPTPDTIGIEPAVADRPFANASSRTLTEAVLPEVDANLPIGAVVARDFDARLGDLIGLLGAPTDPSYWLGRLTAALDDLAAETPERLEWAFRGHLDLFSSRLDAWWTSLAHRRLEDHRTARPSGIHVGCWGWVEDLRPSAGSGSLGYVHAPSLGHAATTAVLRSGRQAHQDEGGSLFDIEITSPRTREALALLRGVAHGQRVAALLGYRLERRLQDTGPEFAQYIWKLRTLAPMRSDDAEADVPKETIAARDVVDALTLLDRWKTDRAGVLADAGVAAGHRDGVSAALDAVAGLYDAVGDVLVAEAVHQAAQGNLERSGAALAAHDRQAAAPDLEFVETPRPGHTIAQRVGLLLQDDAPADGWPTDARSLAEPRLDSWIGGVLGRPDSFRITGRRVRADGGEEALGPVGLEVLGLGALSVAIAAQRPAEGRPTELEARFALALAAEVADPAADDRIELFADGPETAPERGLGLLLALAAPIAGMLAAPIATGTELRGTDDTGPGDGTPVATFDLVDLAKRAKAVLAALDAAASAITLAVGDGSPEALAAALVGAAPFDPDAVPHVPPGHADAAAVLLAQAQAVGGRLDAVHEAAGTAFAAAPADGMIEVNRLRDVVRAVLGPAQPVMPLLELADAAPSSSSLADRAALTRGDQLAPIAWLHQHALVRPALDGLATVLLHAEADGRPVADELRVIQAPHRPGAPWCALPFAKDGPPAHGTAALVAHAPGSLDLSKPFAGLIVDTWTETIPASRETTAVTFHHDAPGARAPQSVVLAVHPSLHPKTWDLATLLDTVQEAADLARLRTLSAKELAPLGGFLPALYLPDDYTRDVPSVPLNHLVEAAKATGMIAVDRAVLGKG